MGFYPYGVDLVIITQPLLGTSLIGVRASSNIQCAYQITISVAGAIINMVSAIPYRGRLQANQSNYYQYGMSYLPAGTDLRLSLSLNTDYGNADIYVSDTLQKPSPRQYNW